MNWLYLFFLFVIVTTEPITKLPVYHKEYIEVLVGNPGQYLKLRMDRNSNTTIVLFDAPYKHSQTTVIYENGIGSELFYMGCVVVRLPYVINPSLRTFDTKVTYHGVIGLGKESLIWTHWPRATIGPATLCLGDYDHGVDRNTYKPFNLHGKLNEPYPATVNGQQHNVYFLPGSKYTYLPRELYIKHDLKEPLPLFYFESDASLGLDEEDMEERTATGFPVTAVKQQRVNNDIILGEYPCLNFVSHEDHITGDQTLCPSYDFFDVGNSQPTFGSISGLLLSVALVFWLMLIFDERFQTPEQEQDCREITSTLAFEIYAYVASLFVIIIEYQAFKCKRFIEHHLPQCNGRECFDIIPIIFGITLVGGIITLFLPRRFKWRKLRRCFVETALVLAIWISQIHQHTSMPSHLLILTVSSIYIVLRLLAILEEIIYWDLTLQFLILLLYAIFATVFFISHNLHPFITRFWFGLGDVDNAVIHLLVILGFIPTLYFITEFYVARARNTFISILLKEKKAT